MDKRKKVLFSKEVCEENGVRTKIYRSFIYLVKNLEYNADKIVDNDDKRKIYVLKYHNTKEHKDKFFCRIKGAIYAVSNDKTYLISFLNSFKLEMSLV